MESTKIFFETEDGIEEFYVVEKTRLNGSDYLLVAVSEDPDAEVLILKDTAKAEDAESLYIIVEDEVELEAVSRVFEELLSEAEDDSEGSDSDDE